MEATAKNTISIGTTVNAGIEKVWELWNTPEHVAQWNNASPDWHTPKAENDLRNGGKFNYRMEARDGSFGFDFWGTYDEIQPNKLIRYTIGDGRKVETNFTGSGDSTEINTVFEAEGTNPVEMQRTGWQSILDNFKKYAESAN
jgi:uncharacterized protein YndB with AHSA1/START domain